MPGGRGQLPARGMYAPPRICEGLVVEASRFGCTLVSGLCGGSASVPGPWWDPRTLRLISRTASNGPSAGSGSWHAGPTCFAICFTFPRNCRRTHSRRDDWPWAGRVRPWFGARGGHALAGEASRPAGVAPANGELGIAKRAYVINQDRGAILDAETLARVKNPYVAMALRLEAAFGLRREPQESVTA